MDLVQGHGLEGHPADLAHSQRSATSARGVSIGPRTWRCHQMSRVLHYQLWKRARHARGTHVLNQHTQKMSLH